ncbi:MAG: dephospho-CoA kinase [Acidobacteriia bacterium]|nr:dephospho-CoA kinase [Terriglobia bacterium]
MMLRVGLTGGYATGKSFIGDELRRLGCHLIRADELGHLTLAPGGEAYHPVIAAFGRSILKEDGSVDRQRLGHVVFHDPARLAVLNSIVHPVVFRRQDECMRQYEAQDPNGIAVVEAAIMVETGSHGKYEKLIVATCTLDQQVERAMRRDGLTRERVLERIARQLPLADKVKLADFVIDTSGSKEETLRQTRDVFQSLRSYRK